MTPVVTLIYYTLSLITGILISVMLLCNGGLTEAYGVYSATVVIHVAGFAFISAMVFLKREKPFSSKHKWYLYLGGAIGVMTTAFNNLAFGRISVSSILALGLLGQSAAGLASDFYGPFGTKKYGFQAHKLIGLAFILGGIVFMTESFDLAAVFVSFAAGVFIVASRTLNAKLSEYTSVRVSTFFNYVVGLLVAVPVCLMLGRGEPAFAGLVLYPDAYIYFGGIFGVSVVLLSNITVAKISAFYLSLLMFVGQVFSGVIIDILISRTFSYRIFIGAALVSVGLLANLMLDGRRKAKANKNEVNNR